MLILRARAASIKTIKKEVAEGRFPVPTVKIGRRRRVSILDLAAYLDSLTTPAPRPGRPRSSRRGGLIHIQTRSTPHAGGNAGDPDCRLSAPWTGLTLSQQRDPIKSMGGKIAAADHFLSIGHSEHFERNTNLRETKLQGRAIDLDRDDLSQGADPRRYGRGQRRAPLVPARLLGCDGWDAILGAAPTDFPDRDVLIASAQLGCGETAAIAEAVGISQRQVRNLRSRILAWVREELDGTDIAAHLDDPITEGRVVRRPPSRAGRKPRG